MPKLRLILVSFLPVTFLSLAAHGESESAYSYPYAFLSRVEGDVSLQRASEPEPEPSVVNLPVLPGDRIWTYSASRAEVRFTNGARLRLDEGTKVDFVGLDPQILVRAWSGSIILIVDDPVATVRVDTPGGSVIPSAAGSYRIDIDQSQTVLSVVRGSANLVSSRGSAVVQSGQSCLVAVGEAPETVVEFNTASFDSFDAWSDALDRSASSSRDILIRSLPHEVRGYASTLDQYGSWGEEPTFGTVWYPQVSVGWAPYQVGQWCTTPYGYTWVSSEPWGWAPYHYGRWGYGHRGWYWIPGRTWGPAWVSFAVGPFWVGWSPLGYYNKPVFAFNFQGHGRYRGPLSHPYRGWNFTTRDDFRHRRSAHRIDPQVVEPTPSSVRFVDSGGTLARDLNPRGSEGRVSKRAETRGGRERGSLSASARGTNPRAVTPRTSTSTSSPSPQVRARSWTSSSRFNRSGTSRRDGAPSARPSPSSPTSTAAPSRSSRTRTRPPSVFERPRGESVFPRSRAGRSTSSSSETTRNGTSQRIQPTRPSNATKGVSTTSRPGVREPSFRSSRGFTSHSGRRETQAVGSATSRWRVAPRSSHRQSPSRSSGVHRSSSRNRSSSGRATTSSRGSHGSRSSHAGARSRSSSRSSNRRN